MDDTRPDPDALLAAVAREARGRLKVFLGAAPGVGALDHDLRAAALRALSGDRAACRRHAERFSWRACAEAFLSNLVPVGKTG